MRIMFILKATEQPGNFMCIREFSDRDYSDLDRNVYGVTRYVYYMRNWKVTCLKQWNTTGFKSFAKWNATVLNST